ncbi:MAG: hypothetical protein L6Q78_11150 [Bacteroidia bacterium]|nr:hypothetical protein [Bacteroidia bacterium]
MENKIKLTCRKLASTADDLALEKRLYLQITKECGVSERTVRSWLANERQPRSKHLPTILNVLSENGYEGEISQLFFVTKSQNELAKRLNLTKK